MEKIELKNPKTSWKNFSIFLFLFFEEFARALRKTRKKFYLYFYRQEIKNDFIEITRQAAMPFAFISSESVLMHSEKYYLYLTL